MKQNTLIVPIKLCKSNSKHIKRQRTYMYLLYIHLFILERRVKLGTFLGEKYFAIVLAMPLIIFLLLFLFLCLLSIVCVMNLQG